MATSVPGRLICFGENCLDWIISGDWKLINLFKAEPWHCIPVHWMVHWMVQWMAIWQLKRTKLITFAQKAVWTSHKSVWIAINVQKWPKKEKIESEFTRSCLVRRRARACCVETVLPPDYGPCLRPGEGVFGLAVGGGSGDSWRKLEELEFWKKGRNSHCPEHWCLLWGRAVFELFRADHSRRPNAVEFVWSLKNSKNKSTL